MLTVLGVQMFPEMLLLETEDTSKPSLALLLPTNTPKNQLSVMHVYITGTLMIQHNIIPSFSGVTSKSSRDSCEVDCLC